jgi:hypothetical protein
MARTNNLQLVKSNNCYQIYLKRLTEFLIQIIPSSFITVQILSLFLNKLNFLKLELIFDPEQLRVI